MTLSPPPLLHTTKQNLLLFTPGTNTKKEAVKKSSSSLPSLFFVLLFFFLLFFFGFDHHQPHSDVNTGSQSKKESRDAGVYVMSGGVVSLVGNLSKSLSRLVGVAPPSRHFFSPSKFFSFFFSLFLLSSHHGL